MYMFYLDDRFHEAAIILLKFDTSVFELYKLTGRPIYLYFVSIEDKL
jgi:hypothetical protein